MRYDYRDRVIQTAVRELSERILTLEKWAGAPTDNFWGLCEYEADDGWACPLLVIDMETMCDYHNGPKVCIHDSSFATPGSDHCRFHQPHRLFGCPDE